MSFLARLTGSGTSYNHQPLRKTVEDTQTNTQTNTRKPNHHQPHMKNSCQADNIVQKLVVLQERWNILYSEKG